MMQRASTGVKVKQGAPIKPVPIVALLSALLVAPGVGLAQTEDIPAHGSASAAWGR